jgi:hypothetical protein
MTEYDYIYTIGFPSPDHDVNAICVTSNNRLNQDDCIKSYNDYWETRKKMDKKEKK